MNIYHPPLYCYTAFKYAQFYFVIHKLVAAAVPAVGMQQITETTPTAFGAPFFITPHLISPSASFPLQTSRIYRVRSI